MALVAQLIILMNALKIEPDRWPRVAFVNYRGNREETDHVFVYTVRRHTA